ncbi:GerAB/ArcD/ProY family transporter [Paenibacillus aestuarii]|uniref:Endospore germination permease n=1 Tax=Paenibacillus aestuarii TaxID=516965 RepID=A0ABW0KDU6_9BACL|nr:endospore germination permease [Paenibacillus aestuarii]
MQNEDQITPFELGALCFTYLSGFSTLYLLETKVVGPDVWICHAVSLILVIGIMKLMNFIICKYPDLSLSDILMKLLGRWIGTIVLIVILKDLLGLGTLSLRSLSLFYTTAILPNTSPELLILMIVIVTTYAVSLGLGTIVRSVQIVMPVFIISMLIINIMMVKNVTINPLLPQFRSTLPELTYATLLSMAFPFGKALTLVFLFRNVKNKKKIFGTNCIVLISSSVYVLISTYLTIGSLGIHATKSASFPYFSAIQLVRIGEFLERFEIIVIGIWTILTLYEIIVVQYVYAQIMRDVFKLKHANYFIVPIGLFYFGTNVNSYESPLDIFNYDTRILPFTGLLPEFVLPVALVVLAWMKSRKKAVPMLGGESN